MARFNTRGTRGTRDARDARETRVSKAAGPVSPVTTTGRTRTHLGGKGHLRDARWPWED